MTINTTLLVPGSIWLINNNTQAVQVLSHQNTATGTWLYKFISNSGYTDFNPSPMDWNGAVAYLNSQNATYDTILNNFII